jgi:hypothetical protein
LIERDLQNYLYEHPDVLFPDVHVDERFREYHIDGKRIDLMFRVADVHYIVELKAVPLTREHIGQVVEYYGLMRSAMRKGAFKMILVAPSIAEYRSTFLQEIGIRCVEIQRVPSAPADVERLQHVASEKRKQEEAEAKVDSWLPELRSISYDDLVRPVSKQSLAISHRVLRNTAEGVRRAFAEYETLPIKMMRAESGHVICGQAPMTLNAPPRFAGGGAWWAYAFGESEQMPKNDVPNISVEAMPWGMDVCVNAELRTSQRVMLDRIREVQERFDRLAAEHGGLQFHALLKLEHQPRIYHWIPLIAKEPGTWRGTDIVAAYEQIERDYNRVRDEWIAWVSTHQRDLSSSQAQQMQKTNKQPNLALRLVRPFRRNDEFWAKPYAAQCEAIVAECKRMKPLIDLLH